MGEFFPFHLHRMRQRAPANLFHIAHPHIPQAAYASSPCIIVVRSRLAPDNLSEPCGDNTVKPVSTRGVVVKSTSLGPLHSCPLRR
jgi:hypothetical protein